MTVFRPKCGTALQVRTNAPQRDMFYCVPGDMGLSPRVATVLLDRYAAEGPCHRPGPRCQPSPGECTVACTGTAPVAAYGRTRSWNARAAAGTCAIWFMI